MIAGIYIICVDLHGCTAVTIAECIIILLLKIDFMVKSAVVWLLGIIRVFLLLDFLERLGIDGKVVANSSV